MWRFVQRSPPHPQDAGNEGIYLQQRNKCRKLGSLLTDCGLHVNVEVTEPEAVSYMDVIKNAQHTREDIYNREETYSLSIRFYCVIVTELQCWREIKSMPYNSLGFYYHRVIDWAVQALKIQLNHDIFILRLQSQIAATLLNNYPPCTHSLICTIHSCKYTHKPECVQNCSCLNECCHCGE